MALYQKVTSSCFAVSLGMLPAVPHRWPRCAARVKNSGFDDEIKFSEGCIRTHNFTVTSSQVSLPMENGNGAYSLKTSML